MTETNSTIRTLGDVLNFMAPFAGGSVPSSTDQEYTDWVRWIQVKQEEYARRAFWRRCLTRETITLEVGETKVLPDRFNKPNALYMLIVEDDDGNQVDWNEPGNSDEQNIFIEMINDPDSDDFGSWQMRFLNEIETETTATIWYFSNPPKPTATTDILLLPGDMIAYSALAEYYRQANQDGSQDSASQDAENRFTEYLSMEVLPDKNSLMTHNNNNPKVDYLQKAKGYYTTRTNRNYNY